MEKFCMDQESGSWDGWRPGALSISIISLQCVLNMTADQ
jgi:hypothetical protein